jgi:hypothetical protein
MNKEILTMNEYMWLEALANSAKTALKIDEAKE